MISTECGAWCCLIKFKIKCNLQIASNKIYAGCHNKVSSGHAASLMFEVFMQISSTQTQLKHCTSAMRVKLIHLILQSLYASHKAFRSVLIVFMSEVENDLIQFSGALNLDQE